MDWNELVAAGRRPESINGETLRHTTVVKTDEDLESNDYAIDES